MLEALGRNTTGWPTKAVEEFRLLSSTQHVNNVRLGAPAAAALRDGDRMALLGGAFDRAPRVVDVRSIARRRGQHNIPNVALHQWRLQAYPIRLGEAAAAGPGQFRFDPLGFDIQLYNQAVTERDIDSLATARNLPVALTRRPLYRELEALRQALVDGTAPTLEWFAGTPPFALYRVAANQALTPIPPEEIAICDLHDKQAGTWRRPPDKLSYDKAGGGVVDRTIQAGVDPVRGRIAFPTGQNPARVVVDYSYGAPGDIGGGPYSRRRAHARLLERPVNWQIGVSRRLPGVPGEIVPSLGEAELEWRAQPPGTVGVITLLDNDVWTEDLTGARRLRVGEGSVLMVTAAQWPQLPQPDGSTRRVTGRMEPNERRTVIVGNIEVDGNAPNGSDAPGTALFDGVVINGRLRVRGGANGHLGRLALSHTTLVPSSGGVAAPSGNPALAVELDRVIAGPIALGATIPSLTITDSALDVGAGGRSIDAADTDCVLAGTTLLGGARVRTIEADECLFVAPLRAERTQSGCVRFSYVAPGSRAPRRFRCQPDEAVRGLGAADADAVRAVVTPFFVSTVFGERGYARLSDRVAMEISEGAEDGVAMGVHRFLRAPLRVANLASSLDEYLRFGLKAGPIYET